MRKRSSNGWWKKRIFLKGIENNCTEFGNLVGKMRCYCEIKFKIREFHRWNCRKQLMNQIISSEKNHDSGSQKRETWFGYSYENFMFSKCQNGKNANAFMHTKKEISNCYLYHIEHDSLYDDPCLLAIWVMNKWKAHRNSKSTIHNSRKKKKIRNNKSTGADWDITPAAMKTE